MTLIWISNVPKIYIQLSLWVCFEPLLIWENAGDTWINVLHLNHTSLTCNSLIWMVRCYWKLIYGVLSNMRVGPIWAFHARQWIVLIASQLNSNRQPRSVWPTYNLSRLLSSLDGPNWVNTQAAQIFTLCVLGKVVACKLVCFIESDVYSDGLGLSTVVHH